MLRPLGDGVRGLFRKGLVPYSRPMGSSRSTLRVENRGGFQRGGPGCRGSLAPTGRGRWPQESLPQPEAQPSRRGALGTMERGSQRPPQGSSTYEAPTATTPGPWRCQPVPQPSTPTTSSCWPQPASATSGLGRYPSNDHLTYSWGSGARPGKGPLRSGG